MYFWFKVEAFLFLRKILRIDKIEGSDLKYDNIFLKISTKSVEIKHFLSQI